MEIWAAKRIGLGHTIQLVKGWNTVPKELFDDLTASQKKYYQACVDEDLLSTEEDKSTGPKPGKGSGGDGKLRQAAELVAAIKSCKDTEELDALNVAGDTRQTVARAYAQKLQDLG